MSVAVEDDRGLSAFRPLRLRSAPEEVIAALVDAIRAGIYEPGDPLPRERDLATQLGVSRVVLREAMQTLAGEGVVAVKHGRGGGWTVASLDNLVKIQRGLRSERISNIRSTLETRRLLELSAALLFARRATDEDLAKLRTHAELLEQAVREGRSDTEVWNIDARFHAAVAEGSHNPALTALVKSNTDEMFLLREVLPVGHVPLPEAVVNQWNLLAALETRDEPSIAAELDRHLASAESVLLGITLDFPCIPEPSAKPARGRAAKR